MATGRKKGDDSVKRDIDRLSENIFDVLIIGGGINGAAVANIAALNNLSVALIEKNDFASGTSSKSTKLIHGGLRYLESFEIGLVKESLKERYIQLKNAPYLVKPLAFVIPVYKKDRRPLWQMNLGVFLYDFLSGKYLINKHKKLSVEEVVHHVPGIKKDGLIGGVMYYDAQMDDTRLCLENILSADQQGACVANYIEADSLITENGKTTGVKVIDKLTGKKFEIQAKNIVCCVGPWTNEFSKKEISSGQGKIRITKGVHLVYDEQFSSSAILITFKESDRIFFVIPWHGSSLIGTTDTDYNDNPDKVTVEDEDIAYLFEEMKRVFPEIEFKKEKIINSFAGLRPLVSSKGAPSKVSRRHVIDKSYSGVYYVYGGKYTTYRKIALDVVKNFVQGPVKGKDEYFPLYGKEPIREDISRMKSRLKLDEDTIKHIINYYGGHYKDIFAIVEENSDFGRRLCSCSPSIGAQVVYAKRVEMAQSTEDIYERRLMQQFYPCRSLKCKSEIEKICQKI